VFVLHGAGATERVGFYLSGNLSTMTPVIPRDDLSYVDSLGKQAIASVPALVSTGNVSSITPSSAALSSRSRRDYSAAMKTSTSSSVFIPPESDDERVVCVIIFLVLIIFILKNYIC
jgi:hypothetical protein